MSYSFDDPGLPYGRPESEHPWIPYRQLLDQDAQVRDIFHHQCMIRDILHMTHKFRKRVVMLGYDLYDKRSYI